MKTFLGKKTTIDASWDTIFNNLTEELNHIETFLNSQQGNFKPLIQDIFKVFETSLDEINVVILGQDPYTENNDAVGLAFKVNNYSTWQETTKNTSLVNILKELYY